MTEPTSEISEDLTKIPRARVLSGMRPTGRLHLGNYMGALYNWVQLQHQYECYFFIADYHALTTDYADPSLLKQNIFEIAIDFLSAGLDPELCTIFIQSHVPQHAELHLLLSMITPVSWLERVPTYKDQQEQLREKDLATYGFLGYPLLQSADILVYKPNFVPVGQDQVAHVELTREVARRFNHFYSPKGTIPDTGNVSVSIAYPSEPDPNRLLLPEPEVLLTPSPKLPGTDGRKMSKSYGNSILLSELDGDVHVKMQSMSNGGQRPTQHDPGDPEICPVGDMHRLFSEADVLQHITEGCRSATIRCDECKFMAANSINRRLHPIRKKRQELEASPDKVWEVLEQGRVRATARAEATMVALRGVTGLSRDSSGVRMQQPQELGNKDMRDLANFKDWWSLAPALMSRNLREYWRKEIVPLDTALKQDSEGVWLTRNSRRVFVAVAAQNGVDTAWLFSVKPKSYEILVLLCWRDDLHIVDFVIPQKLYLGPWIAAKKIAEKEKKELTFSVVLEEGRYLLNISHSAPIDITDTGAGYGIIGN
jgi:tryptophanyl-tRNA synthetase